MTLDLPMYAVIGDLPVCALEDGDDVVVEAWDPETQQMVPAPKYLPQMLLGRDADGPVDVTVLPRGEWTARVNSLKNSSR